MTHGYMERAAALYDELKSIRHALHMNPELGNQEFETAKTIEKLLNTMGIETCRLTDTAVMGVLKTGKPGKTVALRADMDALPLEELTGMECASANRGIMHACGHDVHMTAAIGTARLLSERRAELSGEIRFLFQPDEEGNGGAARMITAGALNGVDVIFGGHVEPGLPLGTIGVRYGKFYAASDMFDITVTGKSAHGAEPEKGIDALAAAAELVGLLKSIPEKLENERAVVTVGSFVSGTARNILAGEAKLSGIMRTLGQDTRLWARGELTSAVERIKDRYGVTVDVRLTESYPGVVNDNQVTEYARCVAAEVFGGDSVSVIQQPNMTTEDFGYFLMKIPGTFVHIGVGGEYPLHNPRFFPDDKACVNGAALYAELIAGLV